MELARRPGPTARVRVTEYDAGRVRRREDRLATEEPLEVRLAWPGAPARRVGVTMRTPGHDFELAVGLLHGEGTVVPGLFRTVAYCTDVTLRRDQELNVVTVELAGPPPREPSLRQDGVTAAASACGVCGTDSIDDVVALATLRPTASWTGDPVDPALVLSLPGRLRAAQTVFSSTGGLHGAGLFGADGTPWVVREDIGRHNAVDKVVGARLLAGEPTAAPLLCVSGRIGFEIVQKAVTAGVGVLVAIGAPSSLAVRLADEAGLTVVGFTAGSRFVIYTHPERVGV